MSYHKPQLINIGEALGSIMGTKAACLSDGSQEPTSCNAYEADE